MNRYRRVAPWLIAASLCVAAILIRQFLIQPPEIAHRCDAPILSIVTAGPWWCGVRAAVIMTYAWGGLMFASLGLSIVSLIWRTTWLSTITLATGLVAIVWYTYEPGAVAITLGALVLARSLERPSRPPMPSPGAATR